MEKANSEATTLSKFKTYRDGLMLGLLASRPLRLRNLAGLTLDRTLVRRADGWWIQIPAAEKKTSSRSRYPGPTCRYANSRLISPNTVQPCGVMRHSDGR